MKTIETLRIVSTTRLKKPTRNILYAFIDESGKEWDICCYDNGLIIATELIRIPGSNDWKKGKSFEVENLILPRRN